MALGTTGISTTLVSNTIGVGSNDDGTLCTSNKINKWSRYKPINYEAPTIDDTIRNTNTGFYRSDVLEGGYTIKKNEYVIPNTVYRLGDFRGYNHNAQIYSCAMQNIIFEGAPVGTNIYVGSADTKATFYVTIKLPEFPIWFLPADLSAGVIEIWKGRYGVANDTPTLVGSRDIKTESSSDPAVYMTNFANTTIQVNCEDSVIPSAGESLTVYYYVTIGKTYLVSVAYNLVTGHIYRQWTQDYNDESQWINANVTLVDSPDGVIDVTYTYIKYLKSKTGDPSYMRINTFDNRMSGFKIRAEYYASGAWRRAFDILPKSGPGSATGNARINNYGTGVTLFNNTNLYIDANGAISNSFKIANYSGVTDFRYTATLII
jgi:hypothetical protein